MSQALEGLPPINTAPLFPALEAKLIELLRSLAPADWEKQTLAPKWKVKDVAAHLLDTQVRKLSLARNAQGRQTPPAEPPADLVALVNRLNEEGVRRYRALSPLVLISMMEMASVETSKYYASLDPFAEAIFGVSWAGEEKSANWFDTAREFTERWHHQQQIRLAVEKPGIMTRELYFPVLDCFMRALPFKYRDVAAPAGTYAQFNVSGDCGGSWYLYRSEDIWQLVANPTGEKICETTIPQEIAWRVFTKGIDRESAKTQTRVTGDTEIGLHILEMVSIIG